VQDIKIYYHAIFAGTASLVAYIKTSERDIDGLGKHIRSALGQQLHYYEIPEYFIPVKQYPYGMNDKLNEQALQNWCREFLNHSQLKAPAAAPLSATEKRLITLWQATLGHENFGTMDSFFDVGGNSLLCHQLILSMYDEGYSGITVKDLYEGATVKQLTRRIDQLHANEEMSHAR
jgi:hypothetical protein